MSIWRIKLHRKITDRERYTDANTVRLFLHCTLLANHSDKSWRWISILRWSFITSIEHLATDLKLSPQKIRLSLDKLIVTNEITKESTNKYTMITLVKYCDYNDLDCENNKQITNKPTNKQQTNNKQITTTKECKEWEEQKEDSNTINKGVFSYSDDFESFRKQFPHARSWDKKKTYSSYKESKVDKIIIIQEAKLLQFEIIYWLVSWQYVKASQRWVKWLVHNPVMMKNRIKEVCRKLILDWKNAEAKRWFGESFPQFDWKLIFKEIRDEKTTLLHNSIINAK